MKFLEYIENIYIMESTTREMSIIFLNFKHCAVNSSVPDFALETPAVGEVDDRYAPGNTAWRIRSDAPRCT